ncbi:MAG: hypothetical protein R3C11_18415 [Planctomycetaceae bacterium]
MFPKVNMLPIGNIREMEFEALKQQIDRDLLLVEGTLSREEHCNSSES